MQGNKLILEYDGKASKHSFTSQTRGGLFMYMLNGKNIQMRYC